MRDSGFVSRNCLFVAIGMLWSTALCAQDTGRGTWSVTFENDKWGNGTDGHYTHGTRLVRRSEHTPRWLQRLATGLACRACSRPTGTEYELGQEIYTPRNTYWPGLIPYDRPYAGWIYAKVSLLAERDTSNPRLQKFSTIGFQAGMVGPASLAEETQKWIHRMQKLGTPGGWDNQLDNEPGLVVSYKRGIRYFLSHRADSLVSHRVSPYIVAAIGNVSTYAGVGAEFRTGIYAGNQKRHPDAGWQLFFKVEARGVIRNIFLDGNSWSSSHRVEKKPLVGDIAAGLQYGGRHFGLRLARQIRTAEFHGQSEANAYGTLTFWVSP